MEFSEAYTAIKIAKEALQFVLEQKVEQKAHDKVDQAFQKIGTFQDDLFILREDLLNLQEENKRLKEELREKENWDSKMQNYSLFTTQCAAVIYKSITEPIHYTCPACIVKKEIQILQGTSQKQVVLTCPGCKNQYHFNKSEPINRKAW